MWCIFLNQKYTSCCMTLQGLKKVLDQRWTRCRQVVNFTGTIQKFGLTTHDYRNSDRRSVPATQRFGRT